MPGNKNIFLLAREAECYLMYTFCTFLLNDGYQRENIHIILLDTSDFIYRQRDNFSWLKHKNIIPVENIHTIKEEFLLFHKKSYNEKELDKKIQIIEEKYGQVRNLWQQCLSDTRSLNCFLRDWYHFPTHKELKIFITVLYEKFETLFEIHKPDIIFDTNNIYLARNAIFEIARKKSVPYFLPIITRIQQNILIAENYAIGTDQKVMSAVQDPELDLSLGSKHLKSFKSNLESYSAHAQNEAATLKKQGAFNALYFSLYNIIRGIYIRIFKKKYLLGFFRKELFSTHFPKVIKYWLDYFFIHLSLSVYKNRYFNFQYKPTDDFIFYPLHAVPENSTIINAPYFMNELANIQLISRSMPMHYKLIVKEHVVMLGYRPLSFYCEIKKIPNVILISPYKSGAELARDAKTTITLSGTSALESVMLGKAAIIFGRCDFDKCEGILKLKSPEELQKLILKATTHCVNMEQVIRFLSAVISKSKEIDLPRLMYVHHPAKVDVKEYNKEALKLYELLNKEIHRLEM